jgi:hypothetical protein
MVELQRGMGGGEGIRLGLFAETRSDWVLMNGMVADAVVFCVADAVVSEASLPDGEFGGEAVGEASSVKTAESGGSHESLLRS